MKKIRYAVVLLFVLSTVMVSCNSHEYVDLGLTSGTLWATCNVGANCPEGTGDFLAWGETEGHRKYKFFTDLSFNEDGFVNGLKISKYNYDEEYGKIDNKTVLDLEDDVAYVTWGAKWCMPTIEQWKELVEECTWEWEWTDLDKKLGGYRVIGPNGKSIFLPAAGKLSELLRRPRFTPEEITIHFCGSRGLYWSRSLSSPPSFAMLLDFSSMGRDTNRGRRSIRLQVRPVRISE